MPKKDRTPLTIEVTDTDWKAFGTPTPRSKWLYSLLVQQGGIAESVPAGTYHFNAKRVGFRLQVSLTPATD